MRNTITTLALTLLILLGLDFTVGATLNWAQQNGKLGSLVRYFEYGRSVPGKLEQWQTGPKKRGNLFDVAWPAEAVARSSTRFAAEDPNAGPVVRSYGMSFVNNIVKAAAKADPALTLDRHAGPATPPNFTYALYQNDTDNRRPGDVVVLGVLSSSIPAMAAMSNRTWVFEQPAPFTYPIYLPDGDDLRRIDPMITTAAEERAALHDPALAAARDALFAEYDAFYSPITFGATWADASPFARLLRRSLAKSHIDKTKAAILHGDTYPYELVLQRIIRDFAASARADGMVPIVMLVQSRDPTDADILSIAKPTLEQDGILYLATAEHYDPRKAAGFLPDGHYTPEIDARFGKIFAQMVKDLP